MENIRLELAVMALFAASVLVIGVSVCCPRLVSPWPLTWLESILTAAVTLLLTWVFLASRY